MLRLRIFFQMCLELDGPWFALVWNIFVLFYFVSDVLYWACYGVPFILQTLQSGSLSKFCRNFAMSNRYFLTVLNLMDLRAIAWPVARKAAYIAITYMIPVEDSVMRRNIAL